MIVEKVDPKIYYYKQVISEPNILIDKINYLDNFLNESSQISKWKDWYASNDTILYGIYKDGMFSNKRFTTPVDTECALITSIIQKAYSECINDYIESTNCGDLHLPDYFTIRKYNTSADMGPHADSDDPTDTSHPYISGVLYLNDNYEGGEIEFINQSIKIKPEPGSMVIFPAYQPYVHHPKPTISGNKYMVPFFWYKK